jgi:hypothetical protein
MSAAKTPPARFHSNSARIALMVAGTCFLLVGLVGLLRDGDDTLALALAAGSGLVLLIRGYCSATVVVDADRVVLVGFASRRAIDLVEVRSAEGRVRLPEWEAYSPEFLVLHLSDGRSIQFRELTSRRPRSGRASVVDEAVAYINATLARTPGLLAHH